MRVFGLRQLAHQFDFLTVHMLKAEADTERQQSKIIQQPQKKYTVHQQDTNKLMVWNYHHSHTKLFSFLQFILYASTCFILQNFGTWLQLPNLTECKQYLFDCSIFFLKKHWFNKVLPCITWNKKTFLSVLVKGKTILNKYWSCF